MVLSPGLEPGMHLVCRHYLAAFNGIQRFYCLRPSFFLKSDAGNTHAVTFCCCCNCNAVLYMEI